MRSHEVEVEESFSLSLSVAVAVDLSVEAPSREDCTCGIDIKLYLVFDCPGYTIVNSASCLFFCCIQDIDIDIDIESTGAGGNNNNNIKQSKALLQCCAWVKLFMTWK